jgi:hypothetical protein
MIGSTPMTESQGDARGYSWPQFEPGHTLSTTHGANSPRAIAIRAEEVHAELLVSAPYLDDDKFIPAVNRYLEAAARESLLHRHIVTLSESKGPGEVPSRVWEQATAATRLAAKLGSDLGLDPLGHARIRALSAGASVDEASRDDLLARGRAVRAAREARNTALQATEPMEAHELESTHEG